MVSRKFNIKRYLFMLMLVGFGGIVASYIMTVRSDAFRLAQSFLEHNPKVIETLGRIRSTRLGFDYTIRFRGGGDGAAQLKMILKGELKSAYSYVRLGRRDGIWEIKACNLFVDGQSPIVLMTKTD